MEVYSFFNINKIDTCELNKYKFQHPIITIYNNEEDITMKSASFCNYKNYSNGRDSPTSRQPRYSTQPSSSSNSDNYKSSSSSHADFIYKEANKHHWAKLQSKIKQRLMAENISYIEDEEEMTRRSIPPPPATFIASPAFLVTAQDKEERQRQQKLID